MSSRRVITLHLPITVVKILPKTLISMHVTQTSCYGILSWMCRADCWPVLASGTENMSASDSSSESPRFFVTGKKPSRLRRFSSKYSNP